MFALFVGGTAEGDGLIQFCADSLQELREGDGLIQFCAVYRNCVRKMV